MIVCICPEDGLFYRINSHDDRPLGVLVPREPNHITFLKWDSFVECGKYPLEIDDARIQMALSANKGNVLGHIHKCHAQEIYQAVQLQKKSDSKGS